MGFFARVLPEHGPFTLLSGETGPDGKLSGQRHWNGLMSHEDVEREVQKLSLLPVNVFFAVGSFAGKNRQDPLAKRCLWLDLDGKSFDSIEDAVRKLAVFVRAVGLPPPSIYVHSGRGVHVYWCLDRDVTVAEWQPVADALKAKCKELEFAADASVTSDPARILRAPGSLNRKGESPIPCRVLGDNGSAYPLAQIAAQLQVETTVSPARSRLAALVSNEDLATGRAATKRTAAEVTSMLEFVEGGDRDEWITILSAINDWSDKSEEGFQIFHSWSSEQPGYVSEADCRKTWDSFDPGGGVGIGTLIHKARAGGWQDIPLVPTADIPASLAAQIAAPAVTPPMAGPQAGVKSATHSSPIMVAAAHALAQTGEPRFKLAEAVHWLSNEFVLITDQDGIFYSMSAGAPMTRSVIDDLVTRFMPVNASGTPMPASKILRAYGTVYTANAMGFYPGQGKIYAENNRTYVNQYSNPDDMIVPTANEAALFLDLWNYAFPRDDDKEFAKYLMQFYGHVVQRPSIKLASAPLLISKEQGTGKTTLAYNIPKALAGVHNTTIVSNKVLKSQFSDYLNGIHFVHFDEVYVNGKWDSDDTANAMKNLITGTELEIHPKGMRPFNIPNRVFVTSTSNYEDAISLPNMDERRWGVYYLAPTRGYNETQRRAYFAVIHRFIESPRGPGVLRYIFNQVDLTGFNPQSPPPVTNAKRNMIDRSQSSAVQVIADAAEQEDGPFSRAIFTTEQITQFVLAETGKKVPAMVIRHAVQKALPKAVIINRIRHGHGQIRVWGYRDFEKWANATHEEIRAELTRS